MKVIIGDSEFTEEEFDEAMEKVKEINPVIAMEIEGIVRFEE